VGVNYHVLNSRGRSRGGTDLNGVDQISLPDEDIYSHCDEAQQDKDPERR
jgi:hypothetical protein